MDSNLKEKIILLGKNYVQPEKFHIKEFSVGAIGISIGPIQRHWHLEPNEDAGIVLSFGDKLLIAVSDGHHGAPASELVINTIQKSYHRFIDCETQDQFNLIAESIITESYQTIINMKNSEDFKFPRTATTVSMALVTPSNIFWANIGDSALVIQDGIHKPKVLNELHSQAFVGWTPPHLLSFSIEDNVAKLLQKGGISRKDDSQLILTTDGVLDYYSGGMVALFEDFRRFIHEPPSYVIQRLFQNVIDKELGDNLCAVIINLESRLN